MRVTARLARELLEVLDELRLEFFQDEKTDYPFAEWERKRERVKERLRGLPAYVERAVEMLTMEEEGAGRPRRLDLVQRTMLFLFARLMNKSNRDVEDLLEFFEPLFGFKVSYKSVERLYSDEEVRLVLHNLFLLLLKDEGVSGDFAGDCSGYSLSITKHYRSGPKKKGRDYRYVFRLMDLASGMYVGFGYSNKSEMEAFNQAIRMIKNNGIEIDTLSLDKYYSTRMVQDHTKNRRRPTPIPKKIFQAQPMRIRLLSRQETAMLSIALLHNIFTVRVTPD